MCKNLHGIIDTAESDFNESSSALSFTLLSFSPQLKEEVL